MSRARAAKLLTTFLLVALAPPVAAAHASFGFESTEFSIYSAPQAGAEPGAVGPPHAQAGSHPYLVKFAFAFNQTTNSEGELKPEESAKDLEVDLPAGLVGNPVDIPHCLEVEFESSSLFSQGCPEASQIGTIKLGVTGGKLTLPIFNLEAPPDTVARFGAFAFFTPMVMNAAVRSDDYGLRVTLHNLPQFLPVVGGEIDLWGVPAAAGHDSLRGDCLGFEGESLGECPAGVSHRPFLSLPVGCSGSLATKFRMDSWENNAGHFVSQTSSPLDEEGHELGLEGCDALDFSPQISVRPESATADSPSGVEVDLRLPQDESADGNAEGMVRSASVELPEGISLNPAAGDGLGSCLPQQIGLGSATAPSCPDSSRIGSVTVDSSLVVAPLRGSIYLAASQPGTFGGLFSAYLVAAGSGTQIKIPSRIEANAETGRLRVHLDELPQLPFSEFSLQFDGGPRAPLALPPRCGTFTTSALLGSYASPAGAEPTAASSSFAVDRGCGGGFSPSFLGGATSAIAGHRTGLTLRLARGEGEQELGSFSTTLPRGLLPLLAGVVSCHEAGAGNCPATSRIGTVTVTAGAGPSPLALSGSAYLTDPYKGAPFGLAITIPAAAGPFDLGLVVVRARVLVDPRSARLTIATDPLPRILNGIPLRLRSLELSTTERGLFNAPTFCGRQELGGEAVGGAGTVASLSTPFFLRDCGGLRFAARISAVTEARASRGDGASLRLAIDSRRGSDANLRSFTLDFPRQLSPRLSAIQGACPAAAFVAGPGQCPATAKIGSVRFDTPFFETALAGSAYLVSRGLEALPRIVLVLSARGATFEIVGTLRVSNQGKSSVTFAGMPDARSSHFAINLPSGPDSALGASFLKGAEGSFCGRRMTLATKLVSYNGRRSQGAVRVRVAGCGKAGR